MSDDELDIDRELEAEEEMQHELDEQLRRARRRAAIGERGITARRPRPALPGGGAGLSAQEAVPAATTARATN
eukprot:2835074-Prymnesium_polylepis.1